MIRAFGKIRFLGCHSVMSHSETATKLLTFPNYLMRVSTFIGVTSLLICGWLGVAFFREVPTGNYPVIEGALTAKLVSARDGALAAAREELPLEP